MAGTGILLDTQAGFYYAAAGVICNNVHR